MIFRIVNKIFGIKDREALQNWNTQDLRVYVRIWHWIWCFIFATSLLIVWLVVDVVTSAG